MRNSTVADHPTVTPEVAGSSPVAPVDSAHLALESRMRRLHRTSPMAENGLRRGKSAGRSRRRPSARASVIRRQQAEFNCPDRRAAKREFRRKTALCADSRGFPTRGGSATARGLHCDSARPLGQNASLHAKGGASGRDTRGLAARSSGGAVALLPEQGVHLAHGLLQPLERAHAHPLLHVLAGFERRAHLHPRAAIALGELDPVLSGMSAIGTPPASAQASVNSREVGGSTAVTLHKPRGVSPSGPVM
jgi:hypothetical protein